MTIESHAFAIGDRVEFYFSGSWLPGVIMELRVRDSESKRFRYIILHRPGGQAYAFDADGRENLTLLRRSPDLEDAS